MGQGESERGAEEWGGQNSTHNSESWLLWKNGGGMGQGEWERGMEEWGRGQISTHNSERGMGEWGAN